MIKSNLSVFSTAGRSTSSASSGLSASSAQLELDEEDRQKLLIIQSTIDSMLTGNQ